MFSYKKTKIAKGFIVAENNAIIIKTAITRNGVLEHYFVNKVINNMC